MHTPFMSYYIKLCVDHNKSSPLTVYTVEPEIKAAINFSVFTNIMSLLASINFGIYLVLSPSHAYNTFLLASIYFAEIISCTKFTKIDGKPILQALCL